MGRIGGGLKKNVSARLRAGRSEIVLRIEVAMSASRPAAVAAAIWVLCGLPGAMAKEPVTPGPVASSPAIRSFRLGALQLTALRNGGLVTPNDGADFASKAGPAAVAKLLRAGGAATDRISLDISALL